MPRSLSSSRSGEGSSVERVHVDDGDELLDDRAGRTRRVLDGEPGARLERALAHPADLGGELARDEGRPVGVGQHVAAADVDVVLEPDRDRLAGDRSLERPVELLDRGDARAAPGRQHDDLVAGTPDPACDLAGVAAVVVVVVGHRTDHPLDREAPVLEVAVARDLDRLEVLEQRRARRTRASRRRARRRCRRGAPTSGSHAASCRPSRSPRSRRSASISAKRSAEKSTRSILLTATTTCGIARIAAM